MQDNNMKKLRGKPAIEAAHVDLVGEDEAKLDMMISNLYGVQSDEAADIHASYHLDRIFIALEKRARENGMTTAALEQKMKYLDLAGAARQVASGKMAEAAAVDALFRGLSQMENPSGSDRYNNFYG